MPHEIFEGKAGGHFFRVQSTNGEIVAQSEAYTRKHDAERGYKALLTATRRDAVAELLRIMFTGWKLHEASFDKDTQQYSRTPEACMTEAAGGDEMLGYLIHLFDHWSNDLQSMAPHFGIALQRDADGCLVVMDGIKPPPTKDHYWDNGKWNILVGDQSTAEIAEHGRGSES